MAGVGRHAENRHPPRQADSAWFASRQPLRCDASRLPRMRTCASSAISSEFNRAVVAKIENPSSGQLGQWGEARRSPDKRVLESVDTRVAPGQRSKTAQGAVEVHRPCACQLPALPARTLGSKQTPIIRGLEDGSLPPASLLGVIFDSSTHSDTALSAAFGSSLASAFERCHAAGRLTDRSEAGSLLGSSQHALTCEQLHFPRLAGCRSPPFACLASARLLTDSPQPPQKWMSISSHMAPIPEDLPPYASNVSPGARPQLFSRPELLRELHEGQNTLPLPVPGQALCKRQPSVAIMLNGHTSQNPPLEHSPSRDARVPAPAAQVGARRGGQGGSGAGGRPRAH